MLDMRRQPRFLVSPATRLSPHVIAVGVLVSVCGCLPAFGQVVGVNNFIHSVTDLDKTAAFYRDTLGLELKTAPRPPIAIGGPSKRERPPLACHQ